MTYIINRGVDRRLKEKIIRAISSLLPILAIGFLGAAFFSYTIDRVDGKVPNIPKPSSQDSSVISSQLPSPSLAKPEVPAGSASAQTGPATLSQTPRTALPPAQNLQPLSSGGMGGGQPTTASLDSASPQVSGNPVQTTVDVPPLNVQAGDKTVISSDGTSITVN